MDVMKRSLRVVEIFYSLQGEGGRVGHPTVFIRLAGCNQNCPYCDTKWDQGTEMSLYHIDRGIKAAMPSNSGCEWICWTGGEPTLQLEQDIVQYFAQSGYKQAIESNGSNPIPKGLDYVSISPKIALHELCRIHNGTKINEIRIPISVEKWGEMDHMLSLIPNISDLPVAENYYVSPVFLGGESKNHLDQRNLHLALSAISEDSRWKLSVQMHKLIGIL